MDNKPYKLNQIFTHAKNITWEDTIKKIDTEYEVYKGDSLKIVNQNMTPPTIVCHAPIYPNTFLIAYNQIFNEIARIVSDMHTYISFTNNAPNFGKHDDEDDVLIVQAIGNIKYKVDGINEVTLNPGEALYIPKYIAHEPFINGRRVTLSFGLKDKE